MSHRISRTTNFVLQDVKKLESVSAPLAFNTLHEEGRDIYKKLIETLYNLGGGAGLAAPQIGIFKRMFIWTHNRDLDSIQVAINPRLTYKAPHTIPSTEGCFSIPDTLYEVKRSPEVTLCFYTLESKEISRTFFGFEAIIIQHEMDHLDGRLICHIGREIKTNLQETKTETDSQTMNNCHAE